MYGNTLWCILILTIVSFWEVRSNDDFPVIRTSQGAIKGQKINSTVGASSYYSFEGIPYAQPPVGNLRFKAPVAHNPWNETLEALAPGNMCKQINSEIVGGDEDCLFLNVFIPQLPDSDNLLPVMVWIHGGSFKHGASTLQFYGPQFLLAEGIVYVSINYRLGAFGFLNTEDDAAPGNAGMKDQVMALRWVQENIASFGGDPEKVTIFGESAGSVSVSLQMLSPLSQGLFRAAISQSGSAANLLHIRNNPRKDAFFLGNILGYSGNSSQELVDFLRTKSADDLLQAQGVLPEEDKYRFLPLVYCPSVETVIEGEERFLTDNPINLFEQGHFHNVAFLTGTCSSEGIFFISDVLSGIRTPEEVDKDFSKTFKPDLRFCRESPCGDDMITKIKTFYFGNESVTNATIENLVDLVTDMYFAEGTVYSIEKITSQSTAPVFFYEFSYDGALATTKKNITGASSLPGTSHADDIGYLFYSGNDGIGNATDFEVRSEMVSMWTKFAKTLNPTPEAVDNIPKWLSFSTSSSYYLDIDSELAVKTNFREERMDFWKTLYTSNASQ